MKTLRPNRKLVNHQFDGYKLASEMLTVHSVSSVNPVNEPSNQKSEYSYVHTRCTQMHNHLYMDEWNSMVYFVDSDLKVIGLQSGEDGKAFSLYETCAIPKLERLFKVFTCSLKFPCETLAVICDGGGYVYLIHTGHRKKEEQQTWNYDEKPLFDFDCPSYVWHASIDKDLLHVIVLTLQKKENSSTVFVVFNWLQVKINFENPSESSLKGIKRFMGKDLPSLLWLSPDYSNMLLSSSKPFCMVDQNLEIIEPTKATDGSSEKELPIYNWQQMKELLTITFLLCVTENEVDCELKYNHICVKLKNGKSLLEGNLEKDIIHDASRWYVENNRLEVVLVKKSPSEFWNSPVTVDTCGHHIIEGEEEERMMQISESMDHLTSNNQLPENEEKQSFNMAQLEECDDTDEELKFYAIDVFTGKVETVMNISGHRWLFSFPASKNSTPLICLRHDVDGILWQPHLTNWNHVSTFDAFGYVHASKKDCKFTSCSPNLNYAFITDCSSHVYIYESDRTNLHKHKQYIVRLEDCNRIMGCHATNKYLHILSEKTLYIIDLP